MNSITRPANTMPSEPAPRPLMASDATLRDYFIAHAPAEPQAWFIPVMPFERPRIPEVNEVENNVVRQDIKDAMDCFTDPALPESREWLKAYGEAHERLYKWDEEFEKQRHAQWPAAWADEMLKARSAK